MTAPQALTQALGELLGDARLSATALPGTDLRLWLIDAQNMDRQFSPEETRRILEEPPYWCFCWASGLVLARWLAERPQWVRDKRVLDFGSGSGVAAIAPARPRAAEVVGWGRAPRAQAARRAPAPPARATPPPAPGGRPPPRPAPAPPRWWLATWIPWRWQRAGRTPN